MSIQVLPPPAEDVAVCFREVQDVSTIKLLPTQYCHPLLTYPRTHDVPNQHPYIPAGARCVLQVGLLAHLPRGLRPDPHGRKRQGIGGSGDTAIDTTEAPATSSTSNILIVILTIDSG